MSTILNLKTAVARQLGKVNALVNTPKRDGAIGEAILQYTDEKDWKWNQSTKEMSNGDTLPTDLSEAFDPLAYYYSGGRICDVDYIDAAYFDGRSDPVFTFSGGKLKTNVTVPITIIYHMQSQIVALDGSDNSTVLNIPNITSVTKLAVALYWLSAERDEYNFERFTKEYNKSLETDKSYDRRSKRYLKPTKINQHLIFR